MRQRTLRLRFWASAVSLLVAAMAAVLVHSGFTDAHAAGPGPTAAFAGATSQHRGSYGRQRLPSNDVAFTYSGGSLRGFSIPWVARCSAGQGGSSAPLLDRIQILDALPVTHGSFTAGGVYDFAPGKDQAASVGLTLRGTIRGSQASGTLEVDAEVDWEKHYAPGKPVPIVDQVARCGRPLTFHWSAEATSRPTKLVFPLLARPQAAPQPLAYVLFARTGGATGGSSIYNTWRDGPPSWRLTRPPQGVSDSNPTTASGLVAFQRTDGASTQVFVSSAIDLNATISATRITDFPAGADDPAMSPNGQEIAFSVGTGADCSLWLTDQSGNARRQLTDQTAGPECDDQPAWSPDGNFIGFRRTQMDASGRGPAVTYMMVPAAGGAPQPLNLPADISGFNWAPGERLVFVSPAGSKRLPSLQTANPNGSDDRTILRAPGLTGRPAWSPDGDTIAVTQRKSDGRTDIATVPASGGRVTDITDTPRTSESDPVWAIPLIEVSPGSSSTPLHVISSPRRRRRRR